MKRTASSAASFGDFRCAHCRNIVSVAHLLSGVNNRNHCPYCLWSCHLDLFSSGDRLSACKGQMKPTGLTMKKGRNKYRLGSRGELMLIHECMGCGSLSINRIAADDDYQSILEVFNASLQYSFQLRARREADGIIMLNAEDDELVRRQLFGQNAEMPIFAWSK